MTEGGPKIDVWYGHHQRVGHLGRPQPMFNLLGRIRPASSPIYSTAVKVAGDHMRPLPLGPTAMRLRSPGDFNAEIPLDRLRPGRNTVTLIATDEDGNETRVDVEVEYVQGNVCPLPYAVRWSEVERLQDVAQMIDGHWSLSAAEAAAVRGPAGEAAPMRTGIRPMVTGYDRLVAIGDMVWTDFQVTVPITIHGYDNFGGAYRWPSYGPAIGVLMRWQGHQDWGDILPRRGWYPFGSLGIYRWRGGKMHLELWGGVGGKLIASDPNCAQPEFDVPYMLKLEVRSRPGTTSWHRMKVWPATDAEPDAWRLEGPGIEGELNSGAAVLLTHHTDATFGDVTITPSEAAE